MKNRKSKRPGPGWFTREELADIFAVTVTQIDRRHKKLAPADAVQTVDRKTFYRPAGIIAAMIREASTPAAGADPDNAMLLAPGDSPALERWRAARADVAEIERDERLNKVADVEILNAAVRPALVAMRSTGDRLVREFGNAAGDIFNEGVNEFEAGMLQALDRFRDKLQNDAQRA